MKYIKKKLLNRILIIIGIILTIFIFLYIFYFTLPVAAAQNFEKKYFTEQFETSEEPVNIFLLCYNEEVLLPHTIKHYKTCLPNCIITIYDNESTDNSVSIAKSLGCKVISWKSNNGGFDDNGNINLKNNGWKNVSSGWVINADMDEWLFVTDNILKQELDKGTSILTTLWYEAVGTSEEIDLSDIDLQNIKEGVINEKVDKGHKCLCFYKNKINEINYEPGAHTCHPKGDVVFSEKKYHIHHMNFMGLPYYQNKIRERYNRNSENSKRGYGIHYVNDDNEVSKRYYDMFEKKSSMPPPFS